MKDINLKYLHEEIYVHKNDANFILFKLFAQNRHQI
jgi:hypothetical protein